MSDQLSLDWARAQGDIGIARSASAASRRIPDFSTRVAAYFAAYLTAHGPTSGEDLTDAAIAAGYDPGDRRAFGQAFRILRDVHHAPILRSDLPRRHGHGTTGGRLYGRPA